VHWDPSKRVNGKIPLCDGWRKPMTIAAVATNHCDGLEQPPPPPIQRVTRDDLMTRLLEAARHVLADSEQGTYGDDNRVCCHISGHLFCGLCELQRAVIEAS